MDRLDKIIASQGTASRSDVRKLIMTGQVTVNGTVIRKSDFKVCSERDIIKINGQAITHKKFIYIMMNKPSGVICATYDPKETTVLDILPEHLKRKDIFPAGRLDKDTEGFVLITDDGVLAHNILSPKKHIEKEYIAKINAPVTDEDIAAFKAGIIIDGSVRCKPAEVTVSENGETSTVDIIITEGMYHQIKKMFIARGKKVIYLKRIRMGGILLDESLELGGSKEISENEIHLLTHKGDFSDNN